MRSRPRNALGGFLAAILVAGAAWYGYPRPDAPSPAVAAGVTVTRIVDGDTVTLSDGQKVRYLGIDTPEKGQPFYDEAAKLNTELAMNRVVRWELGREPKDRYDRLLAWIFVRSPDGSERLLNEEMVRQGYARVYLHPGNDEYRDRLIAAQREARSASRGIWTRLEPADEPHYVGGTGGSARYRFHRPGCSEVRSMEKRIEIPTRDQAYDEGRSPCRTCKP
jgi:micrococcal nuclease